MLDDRKVVRRSLLVRCPRCAAWMDMSDDQCSCGAGWRAPWGGISFRADSGGFYDGRYMNRSHWTLERARGAIGGLVTPLLNFGYWTEILRSFGASPVILDLGCAAGSAILPELGPTVGVDLSGPALVAAGQQYDHVIQADVDQLDFPDGQFDLVVSSFVWEHVGLDRKDNILARVARWLAPSGRLVWLFDTDSTGPLYRWLKRYPEQFQASFRDRDQHVGLELPDAAIARFGRAGLRLERAVPLGVTVPHLPVLLWLDPFARHSRLAALGAGAGRLLSTTAQTANGYQFLVHLLDRTVGRLMPRNWARMLLVVASRAAKA